MKSLGGKPLTREDAVADVEHGVGRIVAATVQETVHPPGDAEKRIQLLVGMYPLADGNRRRLVVMHGAFPRFELPQCRYARCGPFIATLVCLGRLLVSER